MIGDNNSKTFISKLLESSLRLDGRQLFQMRKINAQFLDKPGHILFSQGNTQVLVKTNPEIVMPKQERPAEGFIVFRVNCMVCPHSFDENKKNSNQLVKLLEKVIVSSNSLDPQSLCILTGKFVWQIVVDCIVVRDDGNIVDAVLNAAMIALMDMKKPLVTVQKAQTVVGKKQLPLSIAHTPFSFTFGLVENCIFIDPSFEEENCQETRVTVSLNIYNEVCSIHKPGGKGITQNVISGIIKVGEKNIREITNKFRQFLQVRENIRSTFDV